MGVNGITLLEADEGAPGPTLLVAVTVKVYVPPYVGVPERSPPLVRVTFAGRVPEVTA